MDYIIPYNKPIGLTSFNALSVIKKALGTRKVGHTGTLDKFASGLLIVCTGRLTRVASHITQLDKTYIAQIKFGKETDTLDPEGAIIKNAPLPTVKKLNAAIAHFIGEIMQTPPAFSAIHIAGKRASDLTRSGKTFEIPARAVTIFDSKIIELKTLNNIFNAAPYKEDTNKIQVASAVNLTQGCNLQNNENDLVESATVIFHVSKGTYIRSLARDIGEYCNSCAYLTNLQRTQVGLFTIDMAANETNILDKVLTIDAASQFIGIKADEAKRICKINDGE